MGLRESQIKSHAAKLGANAVYVSNYDISSAAGDSSFASPGRHSVGANRESLCTAISYQ